MVQEIKVANKYPGFHRKGRRAHFENPISTTVNTNPYRYELVENFEQTPGINGDLASSTEATRVPRNKNFEILGTGATSDDVSFDTTGGGILCTTDSSSNQQVIILPHLDTKQTAWAGVKWGTENQVIWEAVIRTGASVASTILWAGLKLTNTHTVATDANQVYFRYDGGVANWEATSSIANTDTETDTGVAVAADTNYSLRIEIDEDRKAHFFINDVKVATTAALTNDVDLIPYIGIDGNAKTLTVVKEKISRIIFE